MLFLALPALEANLGWSGASHEPQHEFAEDYSKYRPKTKFFPFFVSDVSNSTAKLYVTTGRHWLRLRTGIS